MARRLVAAGELLDDQPTEALAHALAARRSAPRIAAVREAVGLAAYRAGEWKTAILELRTYQRISGRTTHLAVIADCERALGRPERAIDIYRGADARRLDRDDHVELLIVAAGARRDLGQVEAAAAMLQVPALRGGSSQPWVARLRYAYADAVLGLGRTDEAREWFQRTLDADHEGLTDAAERLLELEGVVLDEAPGQDEVFGQGEAPGQGEVPGQGDASGQDEVLGRDGAPGRPETPDPDGVPGRPETLERRDDDSGGPVRSGFDQGTPPPPEGRENLDDTPADGSV